MHFKNKSIYLVIDPSIEIKELCSKILEALTAGVDILQIWNHWPENILRDEKISRIRKIVETAAPFDVPVLINEEWELLRYTGLHGVHFDSIPEDWEGIQKQTGRKFISGMTCGNDPERIRWSEENKLDYISFCSMFPSASAGNCEIVSSSSVKKAREMTSLPIFLSGGITPDNLHEFSPLDFQGIAVISGIMNSPANNVKRYKEAFRKL